jgi:hypothetical protein
VVTGLQRLGVRLEVTEAVLNHVSGSRGDIVGVNQRHRYENEKRDALERWGRHVDEIVSGETRGKVISSRARRAGGMMWPRPLTYNATLRPPA